MLPAKSNVSKKNFAFQKNFDCVYWILKVDLIKNEIGNKCKIHRIKKFAFQKFFQCMYKISRVDSGVNLGMDPRSKEEPSKSF